MTHRTESAPREDHECTYESGDGVCRECESLARRAALAGFDTFTIEDKGGDVMPFVVYGWADYPPHSVLAGQRRKAFLECFESEGAARAAFPTALDGTCFRSAGNSVSHLPGPDDPEPGGMYPDDI